MKNLKSLFLILFSATFLQGFGQNEFQHGISYQAVARDRYGKEFVNENIEVVFSIVSESPLGDVIYQEIHNAVTSKYGVFSLVIGKGTPTKGGVASFSQIDWASAPQYLKVEVKIDNDLIDMGTMQFLAVPYALYAFKSLEPGPAGPKGDPGDPASDNQTLSYNGSNLSISGGNTVNLSNLNVPHQLTLIGDTLSIFGGNKVALVNQIQDLQIDDNNRLKITKNASATAIDLTRFLDDRQQLTYDVLNTTLSISGGNTVDLKPMKQDLALNGNILTITNKATPAQIDLSKYVQNLTFTQASSSLQIAGGNTVDLSALKDNTDNQQLSFNASTNTLSITNGSPVSLGSMVAFRAKKNAITNGAIDSNPDFIASEIEYNDGLSFDLVSGEFTAPVNGIYTFSLEYVAPSDGQGQKIIIYKNGFQFQILESVINASQSLVRTMTTKLVPGDKIKFVIYTALSIKVGTGSISGYKVY